MLNLNSVICITIQSYIFHPFDLFELNTINWEKQMNVILILNNAIHLANLSWSRDEFCIVEKVIRSLFQKKND